MLMVLLTEGVTLVLLMIDILGDAVDCIASALLTTGMIAVDDDI